MSDIPLRITQTSPATTNIDGTPGTASPDIAAQMDLSNDPYVQQALAGTLNISTEQISPGSITAPLMAANAVDTNVLTANAIDGMTITGAVLQTAATGTRIIINSPAFNDKIILYTGAASEINPAVISNLAGGTTSIFQIQGSQLTSGSPPQLTLNSGTASQTPGGSNFYPYSILTGYGSTLQVGPQGFVGMATTTPDLSFNGYSLPRGSSYGTPGTTGPMTTTTTTASGSPAVIYGGAGIQLIALANRRYRVTMTASVASTVAGDSAVVSVFDGGTSTPTGSSTVLLGCIFELNVANRVYTQTVSAEFAPNSNTVHNMSLGVNRNTGSGTITLGSATAGRITDLMVEDIGSY